jgi:hypothetical protein
VEQLSNDKAVVRLGGIYSLERISRESSDYWIVMETLCAFVREQAPREEPDPSSSATVTSTLQEPPTDVAAVLTVIVRRTEAGRKREKTEGLILNLRATDLQKAIFRGADLSRANISGANLFQTDLSGAALIRARMHRMSLSIDLENTLLTNAASVNPQEFTHRADHLCFVININVVGCAGEQMDLWCRTTRLRFAEAVDLVSEPLHETRETFIKDRLIGRVQVRIPW